MGRPELKKAAKRARIKRRSPTHYLLAKQRVSVSEAKAHLSAVLKEVQSGRSIIVTDHGRDIACIEGIQEGNQLRIIPAKRPFAEVKDTRAPTQADSKPRKSMLDLLKEDRDNR